MICQVLLVVRSWEKNVKERQTERALAVLKDRQSYHSVGKSFGIPRQTLQRHFKGQVLQPGRPILGRFRVIMSEEFENQPVCSSLIKF